jgi:hypothetical protein
VRVSPLVCRWWIATQRRDRGAIVRYYSKNLTVTRTQYVAIAVIGGIVPCLFFGIFWVIGIFMSLFGILSGELDSFLLLLLALSGLAGLIIFVRAIKLYDKGKIWRHVDYICALWGMCGAGFLLCGAFSKMYEISSFSVETLMLPIFMLFPVFTIMFLFMFRHKKTSINSATIHPESL